MPNLIQQNDAAAITWRDTGGTYAFTGTSLGASAGRQGAQHDFGVAARTRRYVLHVEFIPGATRVVGEVVEVYLKTGDGTLYDNDDGTGDIAVSARDKLRNCQAIGTIQIDENAAVVMGSRWDVELSARYVMPILWNATANSLSATASQYKIDLTPAPDEIQ